MSPTIIKWRCANEKCGRIWNSEFARCQKCGSKTEMITENNGGGLYGH